MPFFLLVLIKNTIICQTIHCTIEFICCKHFFIFVQVLVFAHTLFCLIHRVISIGKGGCVTIQNGFFKKKSGKIKFFFKSDSLLFKLKKTHMNTLLFTKKYF